MLIRALPLLLLATPALAVEVELSPGADIRSLTSSISAGDVFIFEDGVYEIENNWEVTAPGTEDAKVVFRAAPGASPVIRLTTGGNRVMVVRDSDHVVIQGLSFEMDDERQESGGNGVRIENSNDVVLEDGVVRHTGNSAVVLGGDTRRITVRNMELYDTINGNGLYAGCGDAACWTQDSVIENLLIHDIRTYDDNQRQDGIQFGPGCQGNIVRDNVIFGINRNGITVRSTEFGDQNVVEGNVIWNTDGNGLWVGGAALVRNNVVFDNGAHAFYSENDRDNLENLVVSFNTFAMTDSATLRIEDWVGKSGMVVANNVVANPVGNAVDISDDDVDEGIFFSTNVVSGLVTGLDPEAGHYIVGGAYQDFENVDDWNFYPSVGSVLRSAADPSGETFVPDIDFNGFERNGSSPTVGAYEFVGTGNPGWLIKEDFKLFEDRTSDSANTQGGCCGNGNGDGDDEGDGDVEEALILVPFLGLGLLARRRRRSRAR